MLLCMVSTSIFTNWPCLPLKFQLAVSSTLCFYRTRCCFRPWCLFMQHPGPAHMMSTNSSFKMCLVPPIFEDFLNLSPFNDTDHLLLGVPNFRCFYQHLESFMQFLSLPMKFLEVRDYVLFMFVSLTNKRDIINAFWMNDERKGGMDRWMNK